jgi:hypothetical protein
VQASSKVRPEYFLMKVYYFSESIGLSHPVGDRTRNNVQACILQASRQICVAPIWMYVSLGMMMGATNSRSRQTSAPGYRLHKETRPWATRDVNNPLPEGGERRKRLWNSVCLPNWAVPLPGHEPGWALDTKEEG